MNTPTDPRQKYLCEIGNFKVDLWTTREGVPVSVLLTPQDGEYPVEITGDDLKSLTSLMERHGII